MQNLKYENIGAWQVIRPTLFFLLIAASILLWLSPVTHSFCMSVDINSFKLLNNSLQYSHAWQLFWGYLNHPAESWLNVLVMVGTNLLGVVSLERNKRTHALIAILYFWLFYQLVLFISHELFSSLLHINRISPSLVITPRIILSQTLGIPSIKISSQNCFPAGHALVATYWCAFSLFYAKPWIKNVIVITTVLLIMPRLFSGAHWLTDVVFSILYGLFWFAVAKKNFIFKTFLRYVEQVINFFGKKEQGMLLR